MADQDYVSVLRCKAWNEWPAMTIIEHRQQFNVRYGAGTTQPCRMSVHSHDPKTPLESSSEEEVNSGFTIWVGEWNGPHRVGDSVLAPPEVDFNIQGKHRLPYSGEIDIRFSFSFDGEPPNALVEALQTYSYSIMSLINIQMKDFLQPVAPLQIVKILPDDKIEIASIFNVRCEAWSSLEVSGLRGEVGDIGRALLNLETGDKLRIALELYAAHLSERQVRVRFLLLVVAMESLAQSTEKHQVALDLLERWRAELEAEKSKFEPPSDEYESLDALSGEVQFRRDDSIGNQIRKLFSNLPETTAEESANLQRRAKKVYTKRSKLVHDGYLPADQLEVLEVEARTLLEKLLVSALK
jgi:hypothetical protein